MAIYIRVFDYEIIPGLNQGAISGKFIIDLSSMMVGIDDDQRPSIADLFPDLIVKALSSMGAWAPTP